jgi:S1-C subfamily serine protease
VKIDDHEIRGIEDYMAVLAEGEPGQTATVTVIRDGKPVELQVTFEGRD